MKKIIIGLSVIFTLAFGFTGCDTDYVKYSGPDYIMFSDTLTVLPVQNNEEYFDIPVAATEACSYDRTLGVEILDKKTNAVEGWHFSLESNTVTIKAGERMANVRIRGIYDNIEITDSLGMVLQDTWLKSGTVLDNIRMGKPDATLEEVIKASKETQAHNFIMKMEKGYDTIINENSDNLSAGERQLLCITRIMLLMPPMLILDEATSSIDTRTELKVQDAFQKLMKDKTSFIVAHRLSTIVNADIILVLKDGKILEKGNHEELMKQKKFYYELYNSQFNI